MPRLSRNRVFYRRLWLNRPGFHSTAYVLSEIKLQPDDQGLDLLAQFQLADCSRSARLDFDVYSNTPEPDRKNMLRKARLLRQSVNDFCDALEAAAAEQKKATKKRPRKSA